MAHATPNGNANKVVMNVSRIVPAMAGHIPPEVMPLVGADVRNSTEIIGVPSENIQIRMMNKKMHTKEVPLISKKTGSGLSLRNFLSGVLIVSPLI
jgi:hypothetical protein